MTVLKLEYPCIQNIKWLTDILESVIQVWENRDET